MLEKERILSRPTIMCGREAVSSGHYLATVAAMDVLAAGGNAVDAGVAAGLALGVVEASHVSIGGVAPIIVRMADSPVPVTIAGLGTWPRKASCTAIRDRFGDNIPPGVMRSVVPSAPAAWIEALARFGTMTFGEVAASAIEFARNGFPMTDLFHDTLQEATDNLKLWPSSASLYLTDGRPPQVGSLFRNEELAATLQFMADEEKRGDSRRDGLARARNAFYRGDIAHLIAGFITGQGGLLELDDLANYQVEVSDAVGIDYRGIEVFGCGPWCQGPMLQEALKILKAVDLTGIEHNSVPYLHLLIESLRLAARDRESYFGDPNFVDVPLSMLLSNEHARELAGRISPDRALPAWSASDARYPEMLRANGLELDTSFVSVVDRYGNAFAATPSDGCSASPIVPGVGFLASSRGNQSWTDPRHPSSIAPGKRPRLTPNPAIAVQSGKFVMPFGTPGHDAQVQVMLQVFLNLLHFGMTAQEAVEAPRAMSLDFPSSAVPHAVHPGLLFVEEEIGSQAIDGLCSLGHDARPWPQTGREYTQNLSAACLVYSDLESGVISAAADCRRPAYAIGR
jgi:gamma-glutamyltranspeptidase/glutathione hydrolase